MTRKTSFYYSFLVLPSPERRAITAVFDVCRAIDDAVDLESDPVRAASALSLWTGPAVWASMSLRSNAGASG